MYIPLAIRMTDWLPVA